MALAVSSNKCNSFTRRVDPLATPPPSLEAIVWSHPDRNAAIIVAYASGGYSYQDIGSYFVLHFTTVAMIVRQAKSG